MILNYLKYFILLFVSFSFIYFIFEAIFNRITMGPIVEPKLKKPNKSFFCYASICMLPFGGISAVIINLLYTIPCFHYWYIIIWFGGLVITSLELGLGLIINKKLKLNIWDYSSTKIKLFGKEIKLNLFGQIDIWHSLGWVGITILVILISYFFKWATF